MRKRGKKQLFDATKANVYHKLKLLESHVSDTMEKEPQLQRCGKCFLTQLVWFGCVCL